MGGVEKTLLKQLIPKNMAPPQMQQVEQCIE